MTGSGLSEAEITRAVEKIARADGGRLLSNLMGMLRDLQLAEDSLYDALESALVHWQRNGLPASPTGWIMQTAKRKAIDRLRRVANFASKSAYIAHLIELENASDSLQEQETIQDDRLKLIFTCCHPALDRKTAVALTLRSVCGLTTEEIARAFLDKTEAMAQRLVRARHKIHKAGIQYEVPEPEHWRMRLESVLAVIYLIFNEGYASSDAAYLRGELCEEAIRLGRLLIHLCPEQPEAEGLLALMLLHHARSATRLGPAGDLLSLEEQDRGQWDRAMIDEGMALLKTALQRGQAGPYQLQAAIVSLHAQAASFEQTDWREILMLYDLLVLMTSNDVVHLNRLVALAQVRGPQVALEALEQLEAELGNYQPFHAAKAEFLRRLERLDTAEECYHRAIELSSNPAERRFLERRLAGLRRHGDADAYP
ncbi:RNA polymerase sigma factor [Rhizobium sp. L1K21]|uniref:RNA polymerase sigma factor n=1 Tax=Rhizobium sp. L1K21 TaxID=2954933 RepID=UPI0020930D61|nr:DUF6596 domain-containing protein [Rhizobium sp. L1K21]MCO6184713.1 RNA polymerase subunit sigma-24 [Rhizobium sp. L1K21]